MLFRRTYLQHPPHLPGHLLWDTAGLHEDQVRNTQLKPSLWRALVASQAPKAEQDGFFIFFFPVRDIGVLWRAKFLHLDPKTNSGRSEALLKLLGKKLLHL